MFLKQLHNPVAHILNFQRLKFRSAAEGNMKRIVKGCWIPRTVMLPVHECLIICVASFSAKNLSIAANWEF